MENVEVSGVNQRRGVRRQCSWNDWMFKWRIFVADAIFECHALQRFIEALQRFIIYPLSYEVLQQFIEVLSNLTRSWSHEWLIQELECLDHSLYNAMVSHFFGFMGIPNQAAELFTVDRKWMNRHTVHWMSNVLCVVATLEDHGTP